MRIKLNTPAQIKHLQNQIDIAKPATFGRAVGSLFTWLTWAACFSLFPVMAVWYPSAWFMAHLSLVIYLILMICASGTLLERIKEIKADAAPEVLRLRLELLEKTLTQSWARYVRAFLSICIAAGLFKIGYPVYAGLILLSHVGLHVSGNMYRDAIADLRKKCKLDV